MYAHYYKTGKTAFLTLSDTIRPRLESKRYAVTGKKQARQLAATLNATPWNF